MDGANWSTDHLWCPKDPPYGIEEEGTHQKSLFVFGWSHLYCYLLTLLISTDSSITEKFSHFHFQQCPFYEDHDL